MSLANGRPYLAIPGPSVMPDRVLAAMHRPAPDIYDGPLHETTARVIADACEPARLILDYNQAVRSERGAPRWSAAFTSRLQSLLKRRM